MTLPNGFKKPVVAHVELQAPAAVAEGQSASNAESDGQGGGGSEKHAGAASDEDGGAVRIADATTVRPTPALPGDGHGLESRTHADDESDRNTKIRYKLGKLLGQGSFGKVYQAVDLDTGATIAVKVMRLRHKADAEEFEKEIRIMSLVPHPNLVRLLGFERTEKQFSILMEYLAADTLDSRIRALGRFEEPLARHTTRQILQGLKALHEAGVIHRDVKPANTLLTTDGQLKLADFGSAKHALDSAKDLEASQTYSYSPLWLAPEVASGQNYNAKVDIWSAGCILLSMLSGQQPWHERNFNSVMACVYFIGTTEEVPQLPDGISPQAKDFLVKALTRDPSKRPSAAELLKHDFLSSSSALLPQAGSR